MNSTGIRGGRVTCMILDPCNQTTRVIEEIHVTTPDQATLVFGATFPFQTSMWHHIVIRTPCAVSPYPRFLPTTHPTTHPRFERIAPRFEKMVCTAIFSNRGRFHCPHQAIFSNRIRHVTIFSNRSENDQTFFSNLGHASKERSCGSKKCQSVVHDSRHESILQDSCHL